MNKTENTPGNKAVFFANYPSVKIVFGLNRDELEGIIWTKQQIFLAKRTEGTRSTEYFIDYPECYIELRSLSQITDEDIGGLTIKTGFAIECFPEGWRTAGTKVIFSWRQKDIDFLRSKGYLLPWRDLSVEEIISYGWAKYENQ